LEALLRFIAKLGAKRLFEVVGVPTLHPDDSVGMVQIVVGPLTEIMSSRSDPSEQHPTSSNTPISSMP
jgi:hypothetical protein